MRDSMFRFYPAGSSGDKRNPGLPRTARAASGHAIAPPSLAMNSRRRRQILILALPCENPSGPSR
jgi:hypothetical protein